MKQFLKNSILFLFLFISIVTFIGIYYYVRNGFSVEDIPPPGFSNSYSFNDKALFTHGKKADILTIGSSESLNNLYSEAIVGKFKNDSYLNTGSWGLCMKECFHLLKIYSNVHQPRICIIASNLGDFEQKMISIKYSILQDFLLSDKKQMYKYYFQLLRVKYYYKNFGKSRMVKHEPDNYDYLGYDRFGAVLFDSTGFKKEEQRWMKADKNVPQHTQYLYLDSIASFCKSNHIQLLFFQSPYRAGLYAQNLHVLDSTMINKHVINVQKIIGRYGFQAVNANAIKWSDNLFVDGAHFNSVGAKSFTEYCLHQVK